MTAPAGYVVNVAVMRATRPGETCAQTAARIQAPLWVLHRTLQHWTAELAAASRRLERCLAMPDRDTWAVQTAALILRSDVEKCRAAIAAHQGANMQVAA